MTFADKIIKFNNDLDFKGTLPEGVRVMNPFRESSEALRISTLFYKKFYSDNLSRKLILGINPGRFGAGLTGIPFTDTDRLINSCGIEVHGIQTYETSAVFVYDLIEKYGGAQKFYNSFYINSVSPLGFVKVNKLGREVNYNYYDSSALTENLNSFIISSLKEQISFGIDTKIGYCLGTGKNFQFLNKLNDNLKIFGKIVPLEHPRYVMQYKLRKKDEYIARFIDLLNQ